MIEIKFEDFAKLRGYVEQFFPCSLLVHNWLNLRIQYPHLPGPQSICVVDNWPGARYAFCMCMEINYREFVNFPLICMWSELSDEETLQEILEIDAKYKLVKNDPHSACMFWGIKDCHAEVLKNCFGNDSGKICISSPCYQYWIPTEKQRDLDKCQQNLPDGYFFDKLRLEEAHIVNDAWPHKFEGSLERMKVRIEFLPSACIRKSENGELAAFEVLHSELGYLNHLYTMPEHRRKGLASKVQMHLAKQLIADGWTPLKFALKANNEGVLLTTACPWWIKCEFEVHILQISNKPNDWLKKNFFSTIECRYLDRFPDKRSPAKDRRTKDRRTKRSPYPLVAKQ